MCHSREIAASSESPLDSGFRRCSTSYGVTGTAGQLSSLLYLPDTVNPEG